MRKLIDKINTKHSFIIILFYITLYALMTIPLYLFNIVKVPFIYSLLLSILVLPVTFLYLYVPYQRFECDRKNYIAYALKCIFVISNIVVIIIKHYFNRIYFLSLIPLAILITIIILDKKTKLAGTNTILLFILYSIMNNNLILN